MSSQDASSIRPQGKTLLLDSNLLLVLLIGAYDPLRLRTFKRVSNFTIEDYDLLVRLLESFTILLTTPHILTEVSNLANSLPEPIKSDWYRSFAAWLRSKDATPGLREFWTPADQLADTPEFSAFGLTDAALSVLCSKALIVTEDRRLSGVLRQKGIAILNLDDLRKIARSFGGRVL